MHLKGGKSGIGTNNPSDKLHVSGDFRLTTAASTTRRIYALSGTGAYSVGTSGGASIAFVRDASNNDEITFDTHEGGVSHAQRLKIDKTGKLLINSEGGGSLQVDIRQGSAKAWLNCDMTPSFRARFIQRRVHYR